MLCSVIKVNTKLTVVKYLDRSGRTGETLQLRTKATTTGRRGRSAGRHIQTWAGQSGYLRLLWRDLAYYSTLLKCEKLASLYLNHNPSRYLIQTRVKQTTRRYCFRSLPPNFAFESRQRIGKYRITFVSLWLLSRIKS